MAERSLCHVPGASHALFHPPCSSQELCPFHRGGNQGYKKLNGHARVPQPGGVEVGILHPGVCGMPATALILPRNIVCNH